MTFELHAEFGARATRILKCVRACVRACVLTSLTSLEETSALAPLVVVGA